MKIDDKTFSFLGNFSETVLRSVFGALIGVAIIILIVCALIAKAQNATEDDPHKRKLNNRKLYTAIIVLIVLIVLWPLIELIKSNVKQPQNISSAVHSIKNKFFFIPQLQIYR
ncbi:hypothetical protein E1I18_00600 [Mycoplasmopsis mucosicanis]|uniref:Uncharacterized protein n=1 Tax=Mycoplasmopsis mucosicanis TaxID=458208 RepID=A0A507SQL8_9BACT|nr:hypothetical protein [Mycoplasmopsis mucosicanis]TQC54090.1 hypothetical protein E1I18_00600 [Mycoplasmopsis mucosicanis]